MTEKSLKNTATGLLIMNSTFMIALAVAIAMMIIEVDHEPVKYIESSSIRMDVYEDGSTILFENPDSIQ